jgi:hypothetical protein
MNSLTANTITFKEIERIFFEIGCEIARTLMEQYLVKADDILEKTRDKAALRHKGSRTTSVKTPDGRSCDEANLVQAGKRSRSHGAYISAG